MKKFLKKKEGFTLVELIIVIAILAILAAIAIPAYSGYIKKANEAADYTLLDEVLTATQFAVIDANNTATLTKVEVTEGETEISVTCTVTEGDAPESVDIKDYVTAANLQFKSDATSATWENGKWTLGE
jgi:prepilin-type N-terminal cleavage/methylation domain-containing protein